MSRQLQAKQSDYNCETTKLNIFCDTFKRLPNVAGTSFMVFHFILELLSRMNDKDKQV